MRKILEMVSLAGLIVLFAVTALALYGPNRLPARIPAHFNLAGRPDAWSSPRMLLLLPAVAAVIYLLMTWVARHPSAFNFPVRVTRHNRRRLEDLALAMIAWLKAEVVCFFAWIQCSAIRAARHPGQGFSALLMPFLLAAVFATIIGHVAAMFSAARS
ncbi:MAG TPA: DUF1648 domain-containing protein [Terracidiphilus sp.]|jgi:uncharacterized membrane protein